jgi:hypothetical protein
MVRPPIIRTMKSWIRLQTEQSIAPPLSARRAL